MRNISVYRPLEKRAQLLFRALMRPLSVKSLGAIFALLTLLFAIPNTKKGISFISKNFFGERAQYIKVGATAKMVAIPSYDFAPGIGFFGKLQIARLTEYSKLELKTIILSSVSKNLRHKAKRYLSLLFDACEKYQVDPVWAISVMWTESHFNPKAESWAKAQGLMQVMPGTAAFILKLQGKRYSSKEIARLIKNPGFNIDLGVFYLRRLKRVFHGSYRLATVAYNMGPNGVKRRLRTNRPVGVRNNYLDTVRKYYKLISVPMNQLLSKKPLPYQLTYVVQKKPVKLPAPWELPFLIEKKLSLLAFR